MRNFLVQVLNVMLLSLDTMISASQMEVQLKLPIFDRIKGKVDYDNQLANANSAESTKVKFDIAQQMQQIFQAVDISSAYKSSTVIKLEGPDDLKATVVMLFSLNQKTRYVTKDNFLGYIAYGIFRISRPKYLFKANQIILEKFSKPEENSPLESSGGEDVYDTNSILIVSSILTCYHLIF